MIAIINYGSGNVAAIATILRRLNVAHEVVDNWHCLNVYNKYILPGVGHFGNSIDLMNKTGLLHPMLTEVLNDGKPLLGICVGMQLLATSSEEGEKCGLNWIRGRVKKIDSMGGKLRLPQMGWNSISIKTNPVGMLDNISEREGFYFLHNYFFEPDIVESIMAVTQYGYELVSAVSNGKNIFGVQFHPEKSHENGVQLFKNFCRL